MEWQVSLIFTGYNFSFPGLWLTQLRGQGASRANRSRCRCSQPPRWGCRRVGSACRIRCWTPRGWAPASRTQAFGWRCRPHPASPTHPCTSSRSRLPSPRAPIGIKYKSVRDTAVTGEILCNQTYVLFLFEGGFALLSAVLVFSESLFTLELEVSNVVSAVADVLHAQV